MNCTRCNEGVLKPVFIEERFPSHSCSNCKGHWILVEDFLLWSERTPNYEFDKNQTFIPEISDTKKALLCPVSGAIMTKYHISSYIKYRLDYSSAVGGIWLDNGEWELLKAEGLADSIHNLVTTEWQQHIQENKLTENLSNLYKDKFGVETYSKIKEIKAWLDQQPSRSGLTTYLISDDPYSKNN